MLYKKIETKTVECENKITRTEITFVNYKLVSNETTSIYKVKKQINSVTKKVTKLLSSELISEKSKTVATYTLFEVDAAEIAECRKDGTPAFLLKKDSKFFMAKIPKKITIATIKNLEKPICAAKSKECARLSAASDAMGGCQMVRCNATGLENFKFICEGYETFNTAQDIFIASMCCNYKQCPPSIYNEDEDEEI